MIGVSAGAEVGIEDVRVRPEGERKAKDFNDVAAHALARRFCVFNKGRELVEGVHFFGGIGGDEIDSAVDGVTMRVDEAGEKSLALEIDTFSVGGDGFGDFRESADGDDLVTAKGD